MTGPLDGIHVLDITTSLAGPLAGGILADLGADVIKIERASAPDRARLVGSRRGDISAMFHMANRGKRSITLDLRDPADLDLVVDLARDADVLVENFRVGVTERLGIDYPTLAKVNPRLVYVSINGFGNTGPYAGRPAFDSLVQAYGGIAALQSDADGQPRFVGHAIVDKITGMMGAQAALTALLARERGAGGQFVDVSMLDVTAWFSFLDTSGSAILPDAPPPPNGDDATTGKRITLRFADGWGILSLGHDDSFRASCEVFGVNLAEAPELRTALGRDEHAEAYQRVLERLAAAAATMPLSETGAKLLAAGAFFAEVLAPPQIPTNEQAVARGLFVESQHAVLGRVVEPRYPVVFSKTPPGDPRPSPTLGQHNDQVRAELRARANA